MKLHTYLFGEGNRRGVTSMAVSMLLFVANDALVKLASETMPLGQIMFIRGVFASAMILLLAWANGLLPLLPRVGNRIVLGRGILDLGASILYLAALFNMPIGNITAINMASPLVMTAVAALFMAEKVGWRRWSAVVIGFGGVLMIVQPKAEAFNSWSMVAIASIVFIVARDLLTRRLDPSLPSLVVVLANSIIIMLGGGAMSAFQGWVPITGKDLALLAAASVFLIGGYQLIIDSMRHGELSLVSPFRFSALVWALGAGLVIWGDLPNLLALAGICVVVGSGLYILHRERVRGKTAAS